MEIIIHDLSKEYYGGVLRDLRGFQKSMRHPARDKRRKALDSITLTIPAGIYGLLGRNGAGKTSLIRILAGLSLPAGGEVRINGAAVNAARVREMVGYLPQNFSMYKNMTVSGAMDYLGLLSEIPDSVRKDRIRRLLEKVNLTEHAGVKIRHLSGGMKQRLGIAQALLHDPGILIVDEPTAGLDPEERVRFRNLLHDFAETGRPSTQGISGAESISDAGGSDPCGSSDGRIVIFSTHIASDIESVCGGVAVLHEGRLLFQGSTAELAARAEGKVYLITAPREQEQQIKDRYICLNLTHSPAGTRYRVLSDTPPGEKWEAQTPALEDGYMYLLRQAEGGDRGTQADRPQTGTGGGRL